MKEYNEDDIQVLSARDAVRLRPQLYFELCFNEGSLDALPFEVLCHAFDEYFDGKCSSIKLVVSKHSFTIDYDAGMSLEPTPSGISIAESIMTQIGACSNQKKHLEVGQEFCSLGMATINFAAASCELITQSNGQKGVYTFEKGLLKHKQEAPVASTTSAATSISVHPDPEIFPELFFTSMGIQKKVDRLSEKLDELTFQVLDNIAN